MTSTERLRYKLIPEITNLKRIWTFGASDKFWKEPKMAPYIEDIFLQVKSAEEKGVVLMQPDRECFLEERLAYELYRNETWELAKNPGLSTEILMMTKVPTRYANPNIWPAIKADVKFLDNLSGFDFEYLLENPCAMEYIAANAHRIDSYTNMEHLFKNPMASDYIISKKYSGKIMVDFGAADPVYFPYFDYDYCKKILEGDIHSTSLVGGLLMNPAAKELVREYFLGYFTAYGYINHRFMFTYEHLCDIIIDHIDIIKALKPGYIGMMCANPISAPFFEKHPELIVISYLAENPNAVYVVEKYLLEMEERDYTISIFNRNPNAISFLREHTRFICSSILDNPNIYEI